MPSTRKKSPRKASTPVKKADAIDEAPEGTITTPMRTTRSRSRTESADSKDASVASESSSVVRRSRRLQKAASDDDDSVSVASETSSVRRSRRLAKTKTSEKDVPKEVRRDTPVKESRKKKTTKKDEIMDTIAEEEVLSELEEGEKTTPTATPARTSPPKTESKKKRKQSIDEQKELAQVKNEEEIASSKQVSPLKSEETPESKKKKRKQSMDKSEDNDTTDDITEAAEKEEEKITPTATPAKTSPPRTESKKKKRKQSIDEQQKVVEVKKEDEITTSKQDSPLKSEAATESKAKKRKQSMDKSEDNEISDAITADAAKKDEEEEKSTPTATPAKTSPPKTESKKKKRKHSIDKRPELAEAEKEVEAKATPEKEKARKKSMDKNEEKDTTKTPSVDILVHRLRHLHYKPHPVLCLATFKDWVAVSRQNGSIELRSAGQKLRVLATVSGIRENPITCMTWCKTGEGGASLVGGTADGFVCIVDFQSGKLSHITPSGGGGVFALATTANSIHNLVAAGCEDGVIRIVQIPSKQNTEELSSSLLEVNCSLPTTGASILSLAWASVVENSKNSMVGTVLFAGVADGTIRRYDCVASQQWKSSLRMTVECRGRSTPTRVWTLKALSDGTVITGDSLGHVQFWNGNAGTMEQSFEQTDTHADVLGLAVTADETKVFASGIDSRIVCIERNNNRWVLTHAQRPHTHDVKAVTTYTGENGEELLLTGGLDTKLCICSIRDFPRIRPRTMFPWPCMSPVSAAKQARYLTFLRDCQVDVYKLAATPEQQQTNTQRKAEVWKADDDNLISSVAVDGKFNLVASCISDDGKFLAITDAYNVTVLELKTNEDGDVLSPFPVKISEKTKFNSVSAMHFARDGILVLGTSKDELHFLSIAKHENDDAYTARLMETMKMEKQEEINYLAVHNISTTDDGNWLLTFQNGTNGHGQIQLFHRRGGKEHMFHPWWTMPNLEAAVSAVSFLPPSSSKQLLAVATENLGIYVFDIEQRRLFTWSEDAGVPSSENLPVELRQRKDIPLRIAANPATPMHFLLGTHVAMLSMHMDKPFPNDCRFFPEQHFRGRKKRKRAMSTASDHANSEENSKEKIKSTATLCLLYNNMLYMDFLQANEMVIVEQPWMDVVATFPDAIERKAYAT